MKIEMMKNKYIHNFINVYYVLIHLMNETLKWFPFNLVMVSVILFYFAPDGILGENIHEWQKTDISGKIFLIRLYLEVTFVCVFAVVFLKYLYFNVFIQDKCVSKNRGGCNE
ncbi:hypothetical protein LLF11_22425 [Escherichia coli]|nr:hypothetical protein [Escherichia coli]MCJ2923628.1 hypothetical protein [Escherichia coli]HEI3584440.1 hypothetical protein [Escherichia coli]HEI4085293.1 hypothetical protein [Escherichia coli]